MKNILTSLRVSVVAVLTLTFVVSALYPAVVWGFAQALFTAKANGSLLEKNGKVVGSALLGQTFSSPKYFQSRPSAAGKGYDAANSGGSNSGPINDKYLSGVKQLAENYRQVNGLATDVMIPVDAVTASGSGLDPHISPRNAELQLHRVARERGLGEAEVRRLVNDSTDNPDLGVLGEPGVNVLRLNLALDESGK